MTDLAMTMTFCMTLARLHALRKANRRCLESIMGSHDQSVTKHVIPIKLIARLTVTGCLCFPVQIYFEL